MKPFVFSLERVRDYKEQLLDREKMHLAELRRRREELIKRLTEINACIESKNRELQRLQDEGAYVSEITPLCFVIENAKDQREAILAALKRPPKLSNFRGRRL